MAMLHSNTANSFTPEAYGDLVDLAIKAQSVTARTATTVPTDKVKINFPIWTADPTVGWYNENDEIAETDGATDEVEVTPTKTAGLTPVSNELAEDSTPAVADQVAAGLANQITRAIDAAFLGNTTAKGPNGLLSINYTPVAVGTSLVNLDAFVAGRYAAEAAGSKLTSWIVRPEVAEQLSKLKTASGSNQPLLAFVEDGITIAGLPVVVSNQVDADTVAWGIPADHVKFVMRKGTRVEKFPNVQRDGIWLRAVSRLGIGFVNEPGVVRLMLTPIAYTVNVGSASAGTFTLSLNGKASATIAYNASTATVKSTIVAIDDGVSADDVTVTGSAGDYTITVPGTLTADFSGLTDGEDADISVA
ncbi:phage major capsid protein [Mycolicibacterium smegmatis]|nr:phage major capsid protein [Mycolicibacterium smegmatis]MCP2626507.1 phage major capsid protein [Mycolicibacterium smegmatis]